MCPKPPLPRWLRPAPAWEQVWWAVEPSLPLAGLEALETALADDDPALVQGCTVYGRPTKMACLIAYAVWQGLGLTDPDDVEQAFGRVLFEADERLGECGGTRWLLTPWDAWPRKEAFAALLPLVTEARRAREESQRLTEETPCTAATAGD